VAAQTKAVARAGGTVIASRALSIAQKDGFAEIKLDNGQTVAAAKVLVAAGGFTNAPGLLPEPLDLTVYGRTVSLFEVSAVEAARLSAMPSMILKEEDVMLGVYMLPPILYPDGKYYLKIGGDVVDVPLATFDDVLAWYKTTGDQGNFDRLVAMMKRLVPSLEILSMRPVTCVTSYTKSLYPAIGATSAPSIFVMAGGCGAAAKSSDEIGRLGSETLVHGAVVDPAYSADFTPRFV